MFKYLAVLALMAFVTADESSSTEKAANIEFEQDALMAHNLYRRIHGVSPLKLNHALSRMALKRAKDLAINGKLNVKQIMFNESTLGETVGVVDGFSSYNGISATQLWYSVVNKFDEEGESSNEGASFTQMVWKATKQVGFAIAKSSDGKFYFVAEYYPSGNIRGQYNDQVFQLTDSKMNMKDTVVVEKTDCVSPKTVALWKSLLKKFGMERNEVEQKVVEDEEDKEDMEDDEVEDMETEFDDIINARPDAVDEVNELESDLNDLVFASTTEAPRLTTTTDKMTTTTTTEKMINTITTTEKMITMPTFVSEEKEEEKKEEKLSEIDLLTKEIKRLLAKKNGKKTTTTTEKMTTTTTMAPTTKMVPITTMAPITTTTTTMAPTTTTIMITTTTSTEKPKKKAALAKLLLDIDNDKLDLGDELEQLLTLLDLRKSKETTVVKERKEKVMITTTPAPAHKPFLITMPPTTTTPVALINDSPAEGSHDLQFDEEENYDFEAFFATTTTAAPTTQRPTTEAPRLTTTTSVPITTPTSTTTTTTKPVVVQREKEKKIDRAILKRLLSMLGQ